MWKLHYMIYESQMISDGEMKWDVRFCEWMSTMYYDFLLRMLPDILIAKRTVSVLLPAGNKVWNWVSNELYMHLTTAENFTLCHHQ